MARRKKEDEIPSLMKKSHIRPIAPTPKVILKPRTGALGQILPQTPIEVNSEESGAEERGRDEEAPSAKKQVEDEDPQDEVLNDLLAEYTTLFDTPAPRDPTPPQGQEREMT